ncbi:MAG: ABC transporter permease subunit [Gammaproteobacteria bacterium]|nr:ABC transporter permease subunit [Gammaproteobacteria bacterium]MCP5200611.1 ABC transporter permease subunit [Gammaproteobacteria bacterium]
MPSDTPAVPVSDVRTTSPRERMRLLKDRLFGLAMGVGGISVIIAILLIFFYLFYTVLPLFEAATVRPAATVSVADDAATDLVALDEYTEIGFAADARGDWRFVDVADGRERLAGNLLGPDAGTTRVTALAAGSPAAGTLFAGTSDGRVVIARTRYSVSYPDDQRLVTPALGFPYGTEPHDVAGDGAAIRLLAGQADDDEATIAAVTADGRLLLLNITRQTSLLDDEVSFELGRAELDLDGEDVVHILMNPGQRRLFTVSTNGVLSFYDIANKASPVLVDRASLFDDDSRVTAAAMLSGGVSLVFGDSRGRLAQWFPVRDAHNTYTLAQVREFEPLPAGISHIAPEYFRKGFAAIDDAGNLGLYHATAARQLTVLPTGARTVTALAFAPRADGIIYSDASGEYHTLAVHNPHPEVSWRALWGKVWYENREGPEFIWQSSSASADFEPKFSLTPLAFGTFKAAFYSMLFAMPLAVLGAIYTAYFMSPPARSIVKPTIEVMAALPTVILGFLAGLWLAPLIERDLVGFFLCIPALPLAMVAAAFAWTRLPAAIRHRVPEGWEALLLVPVICATAWLCIELGQWLEVLFFGGSAPHWLHETWGITYDQRNSLVVGIAIGFAVIPTIFTISEDAVFSVPRSLTMGSLALGATPWQTAIKVVLLTASPGIFSALMIGMGRAVGETMIVLMATGNTPIMDLNIFQGFRALSANIAVEMPESEVHSTHYRVLFLAALVLFLVTFAVNTLAEIVRQRLRRKYASL